VKKPLKGELPNSPFKTSQFTHEAEGGEEWDTPLIKKIKKKQSMALTMGNSITMFSQHTKQ